MGPRTPDRAAAIKHQQLLFRLSQALGVADHASNAS